MDDPKQNLGKIEITAEMIEVGLEVLWYHSAEDGSEQRREIVAEIYEVMARLKSDHRNMSSESMKVESSITVLLG